MRRAETERVWSRLEPRAQDQEMKDALEAPVRDPLWMLSRQWQVSEFEGEDAGSPIRAELSMAGDPLSRIDLRGGGRGADLDGEASSEEKPSLDALGAGPGDPFDYEGEPLEATVERERVMTDDDPPTRLRVEAGQQFLRILSEAGYADLSPKDFPAELRLDEPDEALESPDRRYVDLMTDRALDGTALARAIQSAVGNIDAVVEGTASSWSGVTASELPLPSDKSRNDTFDGCVEDYYGWYVYLYEEPTERTGSAWDPTRLEYRFAVSTGDAETESVLEAEEYHGGGLDWYNFSAVDETLQTATSDETRKWSKTVLPSQITFPGMPASRWWELEDTDVDLSKMIAEGAPLTRLMLTEFATVYGNDWFRIPVESPVGTLTRVTDLTVTDSFGVTTEATSATDDKWHMFMHDLPNHDEPGLFVPPTLGTSWTGDPVEKVTFARDELANLVFAIERIYESPTGRAVDRTEFDRPALYVENVFENDNPDDEYLVLENTGEDGLDIDGYVLEANTGGTPTTLHEFGQFTLGPDETVSIYTGQAPPDEERVVGAGKPDTVLEPADSVSVRSDEGRLVRRKLLTGPSDALADYRLSTDVPDYWFPFTVERGREYRLKQSLLLDADSLGLPIEEIPRPLGEILNPPDEHLPAGEEVYQLFDEEVTRSGQTVTRQYQFARWLDGSSYLWSSRESRPGDTQLDSGLRFDILDERA
jgi:hypothetical protein